MMPLSLSVNGQPVETHVEPRTHLGEFLREQQGLTGTHISCEQGVCGACTVLLEGVPVRSCITVALACQDRDVRTIEGFDDDPLMDQLREAFSTEHGLQCGFCTAGMLIAARDICQRLPDTDEQRIRYELSGNICRCTGYFGIVRAIKSVIDARRGGKASEKPAVSSVRIAPRAPVAAGQMKMRDISGPAAEDSSELSGGTRITEEFVVQHPPQTVWKVLGDVPAAAACLPGAELLQHDERSAKGRVRVKFGPMSAAFAGAASIERNDATMSAKIKGAGTDSGSNTRARGDLTYKVTPEPGGQAARVQIVLNYSLVGPLAQFSRSGLIKEFAGRLTADFAGNLNRKITDPTGAPTEAKELRILPVLLSILAARIRKLFRLDRN